MKNIEYIVLVAFVIIQTLIGLARSWGDKCPAQCLCLSQIQVSPIYYQPTTRGSPRTFWSYMSEKYQIFEHFNPSCKHFSVAKYFLSNGTSKGFYYALTLLNILNTKLWTKLSSLRRAKLTRGTFYSLHQVFSFQARYLLSNLNGWCRSYLRTTTKSHLIIIIC